MNQNSGCLRVKKYLNFIKFKSTIILLILKKRERFLYYQILRDMFKCMYFNNYLVNAKCKLYNIKITNNHTKKHEIDDDCVTNKLFQKLHLFFLQQIYNQTVNFPHCIFFKIRVL